MRMNVSFWLGETKKPFTQMERHWGGTELGGLKHLEFDLSVLRLRYLLYPPNGQVKCCSI